MIKLNNTSEKLKNKTSHLIVNEKSRMKEYLEKSKDKTRKHSLNQSLLGHILEHLDSADYMDVFKLLVEQCLILEKDAENTLCLLNIVRNDLIKLRNAS